MNYLHRKKLAFMSIVNQVKGFVRTISGVPPITLESCVDDKSVINYQIYGNSVQDGKPTPDNPVEVVSVGDKTVNLFDVSTSKGLQSQYGGITSNVEDGKIIVNVTTNRSANLKLGTFKAGTYTASFDKLITNNGGNTSFYSLMTGESISSLTTFITGLSGKKSVTFTLTEEQTIWYMHSGLKSENAPYTLSGVQVVEGNVATEYEPYGYKIPITASGKNLFDISKTNGFTSQYEGLKNTVENNVLSIKCSVASRGGTLTLGTFDAGTYYIGVKVLSSNGSTISVYKAEGWTRLGNVNTVITITEKTTLQLYTAFSSSTETKLTDIQVVKSNKTMDYEPYHEPITTNIYLNEPLRAIGDYKDYIDFESGKNVRSIMHERINKVDSKSSVGLMFLSVINQKPLLSGASNDPIGYAISDKFKQHKDKYAALISAGKTNTLIQSYITSGGAYRIVYTFGDTSITTVDLAQEKIGDGFDVYYVLAEELVEDIDLSNLPTFKGTTIYTIDTTVQPTNMEVTYYSTVKE